MKKNTYKKYLAGALVFVSVFLIFGSSFAHAQTTPANNQVPNWYDWASDPSTSAITVISFFINKALNLAVTLGGWLINLGLNLDGAVFNSPTVQIGFSVALSVANLGFVLGIIIIAIATILRNETYGIKQMLWKLIVMAILVNFGLVITGPIVGLADNFTAFFLSASGGSANFALNMTTAFSVSSFEQQPTLTAANANSNSNPCNTVDVDFLTADQLAQCQTIWSQQKNSDTTGVNDFFKNISSLIFSAIFIAIAGFTLILIGILLVVRYVYLSILLILLPLAWLTWVFPKFNYFSKWWGLFVKWAMFPALTLFFLYLAIQSVTIMNGHATVSQAQIPASANPINSPSAAIMAQTGQPTFPQVALDEIVAIALCLGGLFAANSLSLQGSETIMHGAKWVGGQVQGYVGKKAQTGRRAVGDRVRNAGKQYNPTTKETTTALQRFGSRLQGVPGFKGVGASIANKTAPATLHGERKEDVKKYADDNLRNLTNDGVIKRAASTTAFVNPTGAAAMAQEIARRNLTTDPKIAPLMDRYIAAADHMGNLETVTSNRPDLMPPREKSPGIMETREEATARAIKSAKGEIIQANPEIFNAHNPGAASAKLGAHITPVMLENAVLTLTPSQLGTLGSDQTTGSQDRQNNITDAVKDLVAPFKQLNTATGKFELDIAALAAAIPGRPELKNLEKIVKHMESNPNWGSVLN